MTAIAGLVGDRPVSDLEQACMAALAAQRLYGRRGPKLVAVPGAALGIDLFATLPEDRFDRQPIDNQRFVLTADIRLDNRGELEAALGENSTSSAPRSDAEILFLAWNRWEEHCLDRIVGDFAFAIFDKLSRRVTLARDATGVRPLCYALAGDLLTFASMPSGVFPSLPLRPDHAALAIRLTNPPLGGGWTCFEGVRTVGAGEILRFSGGGLDAKRYWNPPFHKPAGRDNNLLIDEFRDHLDAAVASRMRRTSRAIATQLSAGYDSSAVTGTVARLRTADERVIAFTSSPTPGLQTLRLRGRINDEAPCAAATAAMLGIEHLVVRDAAPLLDAIRGHSRYFQEPVSNVFNLGWWNAILRGASDNDAGVLLSAGLGNFTISYGGLPVLRHWIRRGRFIRWWREACAAVDGNDIRWRGALMASFDPWIPQSLSGLLERTFRGGPAASEFDFVRRDLLESIPDSHPARPPSAMTGSLPADRLALIRDFDFGFHYKGQLAQSGIDERDPTADRRLIEFCLSLEPGQLLCNGVYRPLAKAALADRVSHQVLDSRNRGYQGADWFARLKQADAFAFLEEISNTGAADLLDLPKLRSAIEHWPQLTAGNAVSVTHFGRGLTNALATGMFVSEVKRYPEQPGR